MSLSKEKALELHREMWSAMREKLGDYPSANERELFKEEWCYKHFPNIYILNCCFLCEYTRNKGIVPSYLECNVCPINWTKAEDILVVPGYEAWCVSSYIPTGKDYFLTAPISKILAIPERE